LPQNELFVILQQIYQLLIMRHFITFLIIFISIFHVSGQTTYKKRLTFTDFFSASNSYSCQTTDSSVFMVFQGGLNDINLTKVNKSGNFIWNRKYNISNIYDLNGILALSNNTLAVAFEDRILIIDSAGVLISSKSFATLSNLSYATRRFGSIKEHGGFIYFITPGLLTKLELTGSVIWQKKIDFNQNSDNRSMDFLNFTSQNELIISGIKGNFLQPSSAADVFQILADTSGSVTSAKILGGSDDDLLIYSNCYNDTMYHITKRGYGMNKGFYFLKADKYGNTIKTSLIDTIAFGNNGSETDVIWMDNNTILFMHTRLGTIRMLNISTDGYVIQASARPDITNASTKTLLQLKNKQLFVSTYEYSNGSFRYLNYQTFNSNQNSGCSIRNPYTPNNYLQLDYIDAPIYPRSTNYPSVANFSSTPTNFPPLSQATSCTNTCNVQSMMGNLPGRICQNTTLTLNGMGINATTYAWYINNALISTNAGGISHTFSSPGIYRIKLLNSNGTCSDSIIRIVQVEAPLQPVNFSHVDTLRSVTFGVLSNPNSQFEWNIDNNINGPSHAFNFTYNFQKFGSQVVCLTQKNTCNNLTKCDTLLLKIDSTYAFTNYYHDNFSSFEGGQSVDFVSETAKGDFILAVPDNWSIYSAWLASSIRVDRKGNYKKTRLVSTVDASRVHYTLELFDGSILYAYLSGGNFYFAKEDSAGLRSSVNPILSFPTGMRITYGSVLPDGNIIFVGQYSNKVYFIKMDYYLNILSTKEYTGLISAEAAVRSESAIYILGRQAASLGILKLNFNGDKLSYKTLDITQLTNELGSRITLTSGGDLIVTGNGNSSSIGFIAKLDSLGTVQWVKQTMLVYGVVVTDQNTIVSLHRANFGGAIRYLQTRDMSGTLISSWRTNLGTVIINTLAKTQDGGLICGSTGPQVYDTDPGLLKLRPNDLSNGCDGIMENLTQSNYTATSGNASCSVIPVTYVWNLGNPTFNTYGYATIPSCVSAQSLLQAQFSIDQACADSVYSFHDHSTSNNPIITRNWTFQGGTPATSTNIDPTVVWSTPGSYLVTLTVINGTDTASSIQQIVVYPAPIAQAGPDHTYCNYSSHYLEGSGTGTLNWEPNPSIQQTNNPTSPFLVLNNQTFVISAISGGCQTKDTVHIFSTPSYHFHYYDTICSSETYTYHGQDFNTTGNHTIDFLTAQGCDSTFTLHLFVYPQAQTQINIVQCPPLNYNFNGTIYTIAGDYYDTLTTSAGCDSIVHLNLMQSPMYNDTLSVNACDQYVWSGTNQTLQTSGLYTHTFSNIWGCDSIVTLNLIIHPSYHEDTAFVQSCSSYLWTETNQTYTTSGLYTRQLTTFSGCDSVIYLALTINPVFSQNSSIDACDSYTWPVNGQTYTNSGTYLANYTTAAGCDSNFVLQLGIHTDYHDTISVTECQQYYWTESGAYYDTSGFYAVTYTGLGGCDSTLVLNLTINPSLFYDYNIDTCTSYTWINGVTYTQSTITYFTETNPVTGCFIGHYLYLNIISPVTSSDYQTHCGSYTWQNGVTYTSSIVGPTVIFPSSSGCDSIVTLHLTITPPQQTTQQVTACGSYTWINGITYTQSTAAPQIILSDSQGCDSIVHLNLTILTQTTAVVDQVGNMLFGPVASAYQWMSCNPLTPISGATGQFFTPPSDGDYAVSITDFNGCSDTSSCYSYDQLGTAYNLGNSFEIAPNPSIGIFNVSFTGSSPVTYQITDALGKNLMWGEFTQQTMIDLSMYSDGIYLLHLQTENEIQGTVHLIKTD
jgi:PKD repeat protein